MESRVAGAGEGGAEPVEPKPRRKEVRLGAFGVPPEIAALREALDQEHVAQMVASLEEGRDLPPISLALDAQGRLWRLDGGHREEAHRQHDEEWIDANIYDDLPRRQWLAFALEANQKGVLPVTKARRKEAALQLIKTTRLDNTEIAQLCGFDRHTIGEWRGGVMAGSATRHPRRRKGEAGARARAYQKANPGASKSETAKATGTSESTVSRGRRRLARSGDAAVDEAEEADEAPSTPAGEEPADEAVEEPDAGEAASAGTTVTSRVLAEHLRTGREWASKLERATRGMPPADYAEVLVKGYQEIHNIVGNVLEHMEPANSMASYTGQSFGPAAQAHQGGKAS
jgi:hypothetical protein